MRESPKVTFSAGSTKRCCSLRETSSRCIPRLGEEFNFIFRIRSNLVSCSPCLLPQASEHMEDENLFHRVVANLYAAPLKPELWAVALQLLSRRLGVNQAALFEHRPAANRHKIFAFFGDQIKEGGPLYERHYWQFDEWAKRMSMRPKFGVAYHGEAVWPEAAFRASTFYNEFLLKYDVCQLMGLASSAGLEGFDALSVYRGPDEPALDVGQYRALSELSPHLDRALATRRRLFDLDSRVNDLEAALNQVGIALILLDHLGRPLMVNSAAQEICDKRDGVLLNGSGVTAVGVKQCAELRAIVDKAVSSTNSGGLPKGGAMLVSKRSGQQLHLLVIPITPGMMDAPRRAAAVLLISDPEKDRKLPDDILRQLFCLTRAESRLVLLLLNGATLPEAADRLSVSHETVRSQVKSVLQKTRTRRQGELVNLLAGISVFEF